MKLMRKGLITFFALAVAVIGCQKDDFGSGNKPAAKMQTVKLSAGMQADETRASLSSEDGTFSWQANDQISVLATDGKFYTLTLTEGAESKYAEFEGSIPESSVLTGVAMYPAIVADATENTIFDTTTNTLSYTLPSEYTWVEGCANVPMIAQLEEGATEASFKQIGSVVRFTFNGLPTNAKVVFTAKNLAVTGGFEIDVTKAGEASIEAKAQEGTNGTVTVNYSATEAGASHEFNIPLPTGKYSEYSVEVFNAAGESLVSKTYTKEKELTRAKLLMMKPLDAGPIVISEVWPFFVDARVLWHKFAGATGYAIYIDDATEPVIVDGTEEDGLMRDLFGGNFAHGSSHKVAIAKVVDGEVDVTTKSEYVFFTTGNVMQMTYNTGTKFVCAGWDDVAIGVENSTQYVNGRWTEVAKNDDVSGRSMRGYRVQLYASDKATLLYEEVPFSGQTDFGGTFSSSTWLGKKEGNNLLVPTALSFGYLEPGTTYYFRVQTLDEPVVFNSPETGYFGTTAAEYEVYSSRGGSAWSDFVELKTDDQYTLDSDDVFYESFDDMMFNSDIMNMAPAVIPQLLTESADDYEDRASADRFKAFSALPHSDRKWSEQAFAKMLHMYELGLTDDAYKMNVLRTLNEYAGSLEGWGYLSANSNAGVYPNFGAVRLGQSGSNKNGAELRTPALTSPLIANPTYCKVSVKVASCATDEEDIANQITIIQYRDGSAIASRTISLKTDLSGVALSKWNENYKWSDADNYIHFPSWIEVSDVLPLKAGDVLGFQKTTSSSQLGMIAIGEVKVEVKETERFYGTAPDNTNYDVWGMNGKMPVTFWMGPPALDAMNVDALTDEEIANIKTTYFDPIVEGGYNLIETTNPYPNSMKKILEWCQAAGVKLLDKSIQSISYDGNVSAQATAHAERIGQYSNDAAYGGAYVGPDEPGVCSFADIDLVNDAYVGVSTMAHTVNLLPSYANSNQLSFGASGTCSGTGHAHNRINSYETYVQTFADRVSVNCMMLDHYCLKKASSAGKTYRGNVKSKQYYDLDVFRSVSLSKRIPYLMITHGRPAWDAGYSVSVGNTDPAWTTDASATGQADKPTAHVYDEQRWLVWSQLALGSKGVSYFCYWTPVGFKGGPFSFHYDGTKTRMYDILKNINTEIQPIGSILMKCHADGAMMTNPANNFILYENEGEGLFNYGPVLMLDKGNDEDVVAGCFRDASTGEYKVLVTHKAPATSDTEAATASIANLTIDTNMATKVKLHTVTLSNGHEEAATTVQSEVDVTGGLLTLDIPDGTAVLVEFPETANVTYN